MGSGLGQAEPYPEAYPYNQLAAASMGGGDTNAGGDSGTDAHQLASGGVNTDPHPLTSLVRALEAMGQV